MTHFSKQRPAAANALLTVVLPLYNEGAALRRLHGLVTNALDRCDCRHEILYVDDGSTDDSRDVLEQLARSDNTVRIIRFSRNFGHQAAVQAGLEHARGDAVVVMDSDLQDDPAALPEFVRLWQAGFDVVYAIRNGRKESPWKRFLFYSFYRVLNWVSRVPVPHDAGNFGLIDRCVLERLNQMPEADRYFAGLRSWVGFRQTGIPVERGARYDERPRVSLWGLLRLAKTALISFSSAPLTLFYSIAALSLTLFLAFSGFALYHKLVTGLAIPGWTSTILIGSFFGALNALGIGILGEYVVRIYDQVRARPKYVIANIYGGVELGGPRRSASMDLPSADGVQITAGIACSTTSPPASDTNDELELLRHVRQLEHDVATDSPPTLPRVPASMRETMIDAHATILGEH